MPRTEVGSTLNILLIEDNPADVELTRQCFLESPVPNKVHVAMDAETALLFLSQGGKFAAAPRPDLILLDLNLPGYDGRQILGTIKSEPSLRSIPVVILTTSDADDDVREAYHLHANSYLHKPLDLDEFIQLADALCRYWSRNVK